MTIRRWLGALAGVAFSLGLGVAAQAGVTLDKVKQAGQISCGVPTGIAGFAAPDSQGHWAGFDVDVFGIVKGPAPQPSPEYELVYQALSRLAEAIRPPTSDGCSIEVISLSSTIIFDPKLHFEQEATLRIRIAHSRGLDQPAGPAEEHTLQELQEQLRILGVKARGGR